MIRGIPSSPGIYMGKAIVEFSQDMIDYENIISDDEIQPNIEKFRNAIKVLSTDYNAIINDVDKYQPNIAAILESNLMLINDEILNNNIIEYIKKGFSSESAITFHYDQQKNFLLNTQDSILRERAFEIENIKERLLDIIWNRNEFTKVNSGDILIAKNITPSELIHYFKIGISGIITEAGGITSHCSILARSFMIPAVISVKDACTNIKTGDNVILNGFSGVIIVNPDNQEISDYQLKTIIEEEHHSRLGELRNLPTESKDGRKIKLMSNVDTSHDIENAAKIKSEGVGLVRTESLIIGLNYFPNEEDQYTWYMHFANRAYPDSITFRAFDIGGDKYFKDTEIFEENPALGHRGIRFLLEKKDVFKIQIRAILRASVNKNIKFMLPMVINTNEVKETISLIEQCKKELKQEGYLFDNRIPVGIMIETPAAALISDKLAKYCDFFSIGTNDLTQYTLAADRNNQKVNSIYDSFHPAVLNLIKLTVDNSEKAGIELSICGEIAGHTSATKLLVGLGINQFSVSPSIQLDLKKRIRNIKYNSAKVFANKILKFESPEQVRNALVNSEKNN